MDPMWFDRDSIDREFKPVDYNELTYVPGAGQYYYRDEPFTGVSAQRYADGKLENIVQMVGGLNEGITVVWYSDGMINLYREMRYGVDHGRYIEWAEDGTRVIEERFERGRRIPT